MVQINYPPKGNGNTGITQFNPKQNNDRRYVSAVKQLYSKQGMKVSCIEDELRYNSISPTRQLAMSKPIPKKLLINSCESTNGYHDLKYLNNDTMHSNTEKFLELKNDEVLKENITIERTISQSDLSLTSKDIRDDNELDKRINSAVHPPKSVSILPLPHKKNRSLNMKDYCDSDFDVKTDEQCQVSSDFRRQDGMFFGENLECEKSFEGERNMSIRKTVLHQKSDNSLNQKYEYLQNKKHVEANLKSSQFESMHAERHNRNKFSCPNSKRFHTKRKNINYPTLLPLPVFMCWIYLLSSNYMLTSLIPLSTASSVNDCRGVRYAYLAKGLDVRDIPRQPRQGKLK